MLKDHSRDHLMARDAIAANITLINKYTVELQRDIMEVQEALSVIMDYLNREQAHIDVHYNDMPLTHLHNVNDLLCSYCDVLVRADTMVRQLNYELNKRFDLDDPDMVEQRDRTFRDT